MLKMDVIIFKLLLKNWINIYCNNAKKQLYESIFGKIQYKQPDRQILVNITTMAGIPLFSVPQNITIREIICKYASTKYVFYLNKKILDEDFIVTEDIVCAAKQLDLWYGHIFNDKLLYIICSKLYNNILIAVSSNLIIYHFDIYTKQRLCIDRSITDLECTKYIFHRSILTEDFKLLIIGHEKSINSTQRFKKIYDIEEKKLHNINSDLIPKNYTPLTFVDNYIIFKHNKSWKNSLKYYRYVYKHNYITFLPVYDIHRKFESKNLINNFDISNDNKFDINDKNHFHIYIKILKICKLKNKKYSLSKFSGIFKYYDSLVFITHDGNIKLTDV